MSSTHDAEADEPIKAGFLLIENFSLLSYAMTIEPLRAANTLAARELYSWTHISVGDRYVPASNGVHIACRYQVGQIPPVDRLFICAGGNPVTFRHRETFRWLKRISRDGLAICGVSGGPYLMARAGLLDGYRFTLHWEHVSALAEEFPDLSPTRSLYVIDRDRLTCAGGLSALDMMHEVIEGDHGRELADDVSRWFLQTEIRSGDSPQRKFTKGGRPAPLDRRLERSLRRIEENLEEPPARETLAQEASLSVRQLDRLCRAEFGMSVHAYGLAARLERAQTLLLQTDMPILDVAVACGFRSASHFSRTYAKRFGYAPRLEKSRRG